VDPFDAPSIQQSMTAAVGFAVHHPLLGFRVPAAAAALLLLWATLFEPGAARGEASASAARGDRLYLLAVALGRDRGYLSPQDTQKQLAELRDMPLLMSETLALHDQVAPIAREIAPHANLLYLGRGPQHPVALEGALKLKEISYIHAEGYAAGEMKHGPIALIDDRMPVVVLAPRDASYDRMVGNVEEIKARGGRVIAVCHRGDVEMTNRVSRVLEVPAAPDLLMPLLTSIPLQLLAYEVALLRGTDVDQPRNLAKSVTVE
jgi:glucosamine--fructose-6-phosphate aminotransferase (isomerizing)